MLLKKGLDLLMKLVEIFCMFLLAVTVVIITIQVIWRYVLSAPLAWTEEFSRYLFIWIVMLGIPIMFHHDIAIRFDLLISKLNGKQKDIVEIIFKLLGIFFCVVYCVFSISLCIKTGDRRTSGIEIPLNWLYAAQPVSAILTALIMIEQIVEIISKWRNDAKC